MMIRASELTVPPLSTRWGQWVFDPTYLTLTHAEEDYEIDLEEIDSSAAILDWIFQIQKKTWADAETMKDLLSALDDILKPQANYCSSGTHKRHSGSRLARKYAKRLTTV